MPAIPEYVEGRHGCCGEAVYEDSFEEALREVDAYKGEGEGL